MLPITHCDEIKPGDNVIVGLGDSFTQGIGAYNLETWKSIPESPSTFNIHGGHFLDQQGSNNWVRQLCKHFLPGYKTYNLGMNGCGNRATIKELSLYPLPPKTGNVIVILLATGLERYDFFKQPNDHSAYYNRGAIWHQKWLTVFPASKVRRGQVNKLEKSYYDVVWDEQNDILEFILLIKDLENLCKANGYKFLWSSAFGDRIGKSEFESVLDKRSNFVNLIDWNNHVTVPGRTDFMRYIAAMEGKSYVTLHEIFQERLPTKMPSKYITPCSHWTIEGQHEVAKYLAKVISERGYV